jgi:ABC-type transport system involved in multi-copper enzyme maturation permease subunit
MTFMELRAGWKGLLIFGILILVVSAGIPQMLPTFRDAFTEDLKGANRVAIDVPEEQGGMINLSWDAVANATAYIVWWDNDTYFLTPRLQYQGNETAISIPKNFEEKRYYAVLVLTATSDDPVPVGIATTGKSENPFQEMLENPAYSGFTGGRVFDVTEMGGFLAVEFFSWFWMLAGLFLGYLAVTAIAGDFENLRMDVLFSTPISRRQYILEKALAMGIIAVFLTLMTFVGLVGGVSSVGLLDEFSVATAALTLLGGIPFLFLIGVIGICAAVFFQKVKLGIGVTFGIVFAQFFMYSIGSLSKSTEWMKYASMFKYWDYTGIIIDDVFKVGDVLVLGIAAVVILLVGLCIFQRKDIPA